VTSFSSVKDFVSQKGSQLVSAVTVTIFNVFRFVSVTKFLCK